MRSSSALVLHRVLSGVLRPLGGPATPSPRYLLASSPVLYPTPSITRCNPSQLPFVSLSRVTQEQQPGLQTPLLRSDGSHLAECSNVLCL